MKKITALLCSILFIFTAVFAQDFTRADTLRGSNGPGRAWWDATKYDLHVNFNIADKSISGFNKISYQLTDKTSPGYFQIDLQEPMRIDSVIWNSENSLSGSSTANRQKLSFKKDGNAWFVYLNTSNENVVDLKMHSKKETKESVAKSKQQHGLDNQSITVYFQGKPKAAKNAPWDGGIVWSKDKAGNPWVAVACQGLGASVWYPCKDYQGDEPDSAAMHFTASSDLVTVSNGRLRNKTVNADGTSTYSWAVVSPINTYNISPYVGKYVHFGEIFKGEKGDLTMDYWVIDSNLVKAKEQFKDAGRMMKAFEYWFGPYPFYEDGYKLVDAPYLGMEHQSGIAYGNGYMNGYRGRDLSGSGHGMKFDFIIIHESGHEWFGNNITSKDVADMWVHESFTNYSEALFVEYYYGKKAGSEYVIGMRKNISNDKPVQGVFGVQQEGSGSDMYYKGSNMIHTIRQVINNDDTFRDILRSINKDFYHSTVTGKQIEDYITNKSGINFSKVFDQYLRTTKVPVLEFKNEKGVWSYRWTNCVKGFDMPVKIILDNGEYEFIHPNESFKPLTKKISDFKVDPNFYIETKKG
ncbi:MAG: M1 family metallopeptidase [Ginsengibacter sp.]